MVRIAKALVLVCALGYAGSAAVAQEVEEDGCVGKVRLRGPLWNLEQGTLEPGLDVIFDTVARTIRERCEGKSIVIEAHAFELPTPALNEDLSELRAETVRHELVKRGVPATQLLPVALGDLKPLDPKGTALENRRITFRVLD
jgi:outer membrane protein OmpA-like peptidoglycan-associated protein